MICYVARVIQTLVSVLKMDSVLYMEQYTYEHHAFIVTSTS